MISNTFTSLLRIELARIVGYQLLIIMGLCLIALLLTTITNGLALLSGALTYWVPTGCFVLCMSIYSGAKASMHFLAAFFVGEAFKLSICGLLFLICIVYFHLNLFYTMIGLISAILSFWVSAFLLLWGGTKAWR